MRILKYITLLCAVVWSTTSIAQESDKMDLMADAEKAKDMLLERNKGVQEYFDNATAYVIFPNVGKGGIVIGGASGNGILYENGEARGLADLKKATVGVKAGGQALVEVLFFETESALEDFKDGTFELSASASAVAVESGASINANYDQGVAVVTMPKAGLMADVSVGGQKFAYTHFDSEDSR